MRVASGNKFICLYSIKSYSYGENIFWGDSMFNMCEKYTGPGCYRFLDSNANTIYIESPPKIFYIDILDHYQMI